MSRAIISLGMLCSYSNAMIISCLTLLMRIGQHLQSYKMRVNLSYHTLEKIQALIMNLVHEVSLKNLCVCDEIIIRVFLHLNVFPQRKFTILNWVSTYSSNYKYLGKLMQSKLQLPHCFYLCSLNKIKQTFIFFNHNKMCIFL